MLRSESDSNGLLGAGEMFTDDCEVGACLCGAYPEAHAAMLPPPAPDVPRCEHCGKTRSTVVTRYSEGYGTEEECLLSDPQGESDADADIEDADCRLQEAGSLQRISSRRRKRPRVARQDTTESEDDGGKSQRSHRWNLRLSPDRAQSRTILEESVSQVRPLIICRPHVDRRKSSDGLPRSSKMASPRQSPFSLSVALLFLSLPLALFIGVLIVCFLLPRASA